MKELVVETLYREIARLERELSQLTERGVDRRRDTLRDTLARRRRLLHRYLTRLPGQQVADPRRECADPNGPP